MDPQNTNAEEMNQGDAGNASQQNTEASAGAEKVGSDFMGTADDAGNHKVMAIVGYILPFLFFLPLLNEEGKKSEFAMFHANQHLTLLITLVVVYFIHSALFMMFFFGGYFLSSLLNLAVLVLVIIGVVNAAQEKMKELPLIGGFKLLNK